MKSVRTFQVISMLLAVLCCSILIVSSLSALFDNGPSAFAEDNEITAIGYDLGDSQVMMESKRYMLAIAGIYFEFDITFDDDFYTGIGTVEDNVFTPSPIIENIKSVFVAAGYVTHADSLNGRLVAHMEFDTLTDYYIAIGATGYDVSESNGEENNTLFYRTRTVKSQTPFASINNESSLVGKIYSMIKDTGADENEISLVYVYGTPYKVVDTDADLKERNEDRNIYMHTFYVTPNTCDREITLIQRNPNVVGWYVLAVIIALPIIVVPLTIMLVKKRKNREGINNA